MGCAVLNNAFGGLLVAVIIKYADNIIKCFGTTVAIILTVFISSVFFGASFGQTALLGTMCVIYSVFLYSGYGTINFDTLLHYAKIVPKQVDDIESAVKS